MSIIDIINKYNFLLSILIGIAIGFFDIYYFLSLIRIWRLGKNPPSVATEMDIRLYQRFFKIEIIWLIVFNFILFSLFAYTFPFILFSLFAYRLSFSLFGLITGLLIAILPAIIIYIFNKNRIKKLKAKHWDLF